MPSVEEEVCVDERRLTTSREDTRLVKRVARVLREKRAAAKLTQEALAEKARVSTYLVSKYERNEIQPSLVTLMRLVRALGAKIQDFVD